MYMNVCIHLYMYIVHTCKYKIYFMIEMLCRGLRIFSSHAIYFERYLIVEILPKTILIR